MPFFNVRPLIAAFLFLFGFLFVGFLPWAFAYESCAYFDSVDVSCVEQTFYDTYEPNVLSDCDSSSSDCVCLFNFGYPRCLYTLSVSTNVCFVVCVDCIDSDLDGYCDDPYACPDAAATRCGGSVNVIWADVAHCLYTCKCPDYTGQENYDFDTCSEGSVTDCEAEYLEAKQSCDDPQLIDSLTCEYTCTCVETRKRAEETCVAGYYFNSVTCEYSCKCCVEKSEECQDYCGGGDNIKNFSCTNTSLPASDYTPGGCAVDSGSYVPCECIIPPIHDLDPPDDPASDPAPGVDPDNPEGLTCAELKAQSNCEEPCIWRCAIGADGKAVWSNCDCGLDPVDPGPDGIEGTSDDGTNGSADDGSNGWLKQVEENTDKIAGEVSEGTGWLQSIKTNTDTLIENDKKYFSDGGGKSVFKDGAGNSYLETIADSLGEITVDVGEVVLPEDNEYSTSLDELDPLPESTFETDLTSYIASGIPLFDYIKNTSIDLSSASPILSLNILGQPVSVDFSRYEATINKAGDILFYLTVISCFILIITRAKG